MRKVAHASAAAHAKRRRHENGEAQDDEAGALHAVALIMQIKFVFGWLSFGENRATIRIAKMQTIKNQIATECRRFVRALSLRPSSDGCYFCTLLSGFYECEWR